MTARPWRGYKYHGIAVGGMKKFKRPKIDHYRHYCYECKHWTFIQDIGCAHIGECKAIDDEPTEQDAYDGMCGLFEKSG